MRRLLNESGSLNSAMDGSLDTDAASFFRLDPLNTSHALPALPTKTEDCQFEFVFELGQGGGAVTALDVCWNQEVRP